VKENSYHIGAAWTVPLTAKINPATAQIVINLFIVNLLLNLLLVIFVPFDILFSAAEHPQRHVPSWLKYQPDFVT
jgi:hypothetical protein